MPDSNLNAGEKEALAAAKLGDLRKRVNADSWSDNMEMLMKQWGEKAAGLRFMHSHSGNKWKAFSNKLSISGIVITGVASTLSLVATSMDDAEVKNGILFSVGGIGLVSTLVQSFKKFYNSEEKAADHASVSKQFGSFYRYMTLQMGMSREDRDPADVLSVWALKEYERLQQEAPPISGDSIKLFKLKFNDPAQATPDIAEDKFIIKVFGKKNDDAKGATADAGEKGGAKGLDVAVTSSTVDDAVAAPDIETSVLDEETPLVDNSISNQEIEVTVEK